MHLGRKIVLGLLLLPAAEMAAFLAVAWVIGFWPALALMVLTSLAGCLVLRHAGRGQLTRFRTAVGAGEAAGFGTGNPSLMHVLAGILLLLPGFITDLLGALLLIPPVRRWFGATIGRVMTARRRRARAGPDPVLDLDRREWRELPDPERPKAKRKPRKH